MKNAMNPFVLTRTICAVQAMLFFALATPVLTSCSVRPTTAIKVVVSTTANNLVLVRARTYNWQSAAQTTIDTTDFALGAGGVSFPFSFTIAPRELNSPLQTLGIEISGWDTTRPSASQSPIRTRIHTRFVRDEILVLQVSLDAACATQQCTESETCSNGVCGSPSVNADALPRLNGVVPDVPTPSIDTPAVDVPNASADVPSARVTCYMSMGNPASPIIGYCRERSACAPPKPNTGMPPPPMCCFSIGPCGGGCPSGGTCQTWTEPMMNVTTTGCCESGSRN